MEWHDEMLPCTLAFRMFNVNHKLTVEELGGIFRLPIYMPGVVSEDFPIKQFWEDISGFHKYIVVGAKASVIQNPCIRYAQKGLAYTMFSRGDNTGVATMRELFFLYAMLNNEFINATPFVADFLGKVGRATSGGIFVGGVSSPKLPNISIMKL